MAYNSSEAYDFSLFEPQVIEYPQSKKKPHVSSKASSAKKPSKGKGVAKKKAPSRPQHSKVAPPISLSDYQLEVERDAKTVSVPDEAKKLLCFVVVCAFLVVALLMLNSKYDTVLSEISAVQSQIAIEKGENVRLNAELSSKISTDKIENYAENVLGMVKAENHQITYIDLSEGDCVLVSGDKSANGESELSGKIKELFAYIF
jgi:cell division protein FtsL